MELDRELAAIRERLHRQIDRRAADDQAALRALCRAHSVALAGGSFTRSLGQSLRRLRERAAVPNG